MSADAWEKCPICKNSEKTIREDIEYGVREDGTAFVSFKAKCTVCRATWLVRVEGIQSEIV